MKKLLFIIFLLPFFLNAQLRSNGGTGTGTPVYSTSPSLTTPTIGAASGTSLVLSSFLNEAKGADIASNTTTDIGAATGTYIDVTGTTTITGLGTVQAGTRRIVRFTGALTLTHNATSLILPGAANITTVNGDVAQFVSLGSGNWLCTAYFPTTITGTGGLVRSTSPTLTTPSFTTGFKIGGAAASGKIPIGDGTNYVASTPTYPNSATNGSFLMGDGTNIGLVNTRENWTTFVVSGSNATTTGQTLVDITGLTSGTLTNAALYEVEAWLNVTTSAVTTGTQYAIFANGSGGAAIYNAILIGTTTTNAVTQVTQSSATQQGTFLTTSGASGVIYIHGFITTRGSGTATISIQHLKVTSGTSTVLIGSKMKIRLMN